MTGQGWVLTPVLADDSLIDEPSYRSAPDDVQEEGAQEESRDREPGRELGRAGGQACEWMQGGQGLIFMMFSR